MFYVFGSVIGKSSAVFSVGAPCGFWDGERRSGPRTSPEFPPEDMAGLPEKNHKQSGSETVLELTGTRTRNSVQSGGGLEKQNHCRRSRPFRAHREDICIHNIITKFEVYNRAEAAILYLERAGNDSGADSGVRPSDTRDAGS